MPNTKSAESAKATPVEVWLSKKNIEVTCLVVREDETTVSLDIDSLSMRGAQREITGWLIGHGWQPAGRWQSEAEGDMLPDGRPYEDAEVSRTFRPGPDANVI